MFWPFTTKKATDVSQLLKKIMNFGREGYKDRNFSQNGKQKCPLQSMLQPRFSLWLWTSYGVSGNASFEWGKMPLSCVSLESWWGFYVGVVFMVKLWVVRSCEVWSWLSAGHDPWHKPTNALFTAPGKLKQDIDHPKISSFWSSIWLSVGLHYIELSPKLITYHQLKLLSTCFSHLSRLKVCYSAESQQKCFCWLLRLILLWSYCFSRIRQMEKVKVRIALHICILSAIPWQNIPNCSESE